VQQLRELSIAALVTRRRCQRADLSSDRSMWSQSGMTDSYTVGANFEGSSASAADPLSPQKFQSPGALLVCSRGKAHTLDSQPGSLDWAEPMRTGWRHPTAVADARCRFAAATQTQAVTPGDGTSVVRSRTAARPSGLRSCGPQRITVRHPDATHAAIRPTDHASADTVGRVRELPNTGVHEACCHRRVHLARSSSRRRRGATFSEVHAAPWRPNNES